MPTNSWDTLWLHATIAICEPDSPLLTDAAIAIKDDRIAWVGSMQTLPTHSAKTVHDAAGQCITPAFIDCHTHLVYAGNRADEFEKRLQGISYEEITRSGGGIQSTVRSTRAATEDELFRQSLPRAQSLLQSGVTTVEIKSGYGLNIETEEKILRVAQKIGETLPITVKRTFLGAHLVPEEFRGRAQEYTDFVCQTMIPHIAHAKLADAVDVFCETIAFSLSQTEQVFKAAQQYGLSVKCHGEQLSCTDSAILSARYHALSVDHLEYASPKGLEAMAAADVTAVLLPAAWYYLQEKQRPPIDLMRNLNVRMALATDCNPGTSPVLSMLPILNMACVLFQMTPTEALQGVTLNAAYALGMQQTHGSLTVGKTADLAIWNVRTPVELCYYLGGNPLHSLMRSGKKAF